MKEYILNLLDKLKNDRRLLITVCSAAAAVVLAIVILCVVLASGGDQPDVPPVSTTESQPAGTTDPTGTTAPTTQAPTETTSEPNEPSTGETTEPETTEPGETTAPEETTVPTTAAPTQPATEPVTEPTTEPAQPTTVPPTTRPVETKPVQTKPVETKPQAPVTTVPPTTAKPTEPPTTVPPTTAKPTVPPTTAKPTEPPVTVPPTTKPATPSNEATYTITVVDASGAPQKNVIVKVLDSSGKQVKMMPTNASGVMSFTAKKGNYTFTLTVANKACDYDTSKAKLTASQTSVTIALFGKATVSGTINAPGINNDPNWPEHPFYGVSEGTYTADLEKGAMTYFIFTPTRAGVYRITATSDKALDMAQYGNVIFNRITEAENGSFELEVGHSNIADTPDETTTAYYIGIYAKDKSAASCKLTIEHIADVEKTASDYPWQAADSDSKYLVPHRDGEGKTLKDVDITKSASIVRDSEGYYHYGSASGPYVQIRVDSASPYLASFNEICSTSPLGVHYYDSNGKFTHKVQYNDLIADYVSVADSNGCVRLNDQLLEMVEECGAYAGWWDSGSPNYRFEGVAFRSDMVKYFACAYYE